MKPTLTVSVLALLFVAPLIKGGAPFWAWGIWSALVFLLAGISFTRQPIRLNPELLPIAALCIWLGVQLTTGISQELNATTDTLITTLSFLALMVLLQGFKKEDSDKLFWLVIAVAALEAVYAIWSFYTGAETILWMPREHYPTRASGTFVNPNHFAAYLNLGICLALAFFVTTFEKGFGRNNTIARVIDITMSPLSIVLFLLLYGLVVSQSIGGYLSLLASIGTMFCILLWRRRAHAWLLLTAGLGIVAVVLGLLQIDDVMRDAARLEGDIIRRLQLFNSSWLVLKDHWLLGIGGGAFYAVFPGYRQLDTGSSFYYYAHNDYLQFAIEFGLIGIALLGWFLVRVIRTNWQFLSKRAPATDRTFALASLAAIAGLATHSIVDFPLQIPGYAVTFLALVSINTLKTGVK